MKRCAIYVYWDKDGVLRDFARYFITHLHDVCERVVVIVNGNLNAEGIQSLASLGVEAFCRDNQGYDFYGYRAGLMHVGFDALASFDEVILCNSSVYGPIVPWDKTFATMAAKPVDFWGLTQWSGKPWKDHIQSYFLVFRRTLLGSEAFRQYWESLPQVDSWQEAVAKCETELTHHFASLGFRWDTAVPADAFKDRCPNPTIQCADALLALGLPILKRKALCDAYTNWLDLSYGRFSRNAIAHVRDHTDYPIDLIYHDLQQTQPQSVWRRCLHHTFVLPSTVTLSNEDVAQRKKVALIFFVYFEDLVDEAVRYIRSMPANAHVFLVSSKASLLDTYKETLADAPFPRIEYRLQPNRGRNEAAYFLTCRDVVDSYDYCCLMHDKKSAHMKPLLKGESMMQLHYDTLLATPAYVQNVLRTFETNPHIGLLLPPAPLFSDWTGCLLLTPLTVCEKVCRDVVAKLNIKAPFDTDPVFPVGTMFWIRKGALSALFRYPWTLEDLPPEPLPKDGTLLHALERLYPLIAQESGYCSAWVMSDRYAELYADNLHYQLKQAYAPKPQEIRTRDLKRLIKQYVKQKINKLLRR